MSGAGHYFDYTTATKFQADRVGIVKLSTPRVSCTLPEHLLVQCETPATKLDAWSREVGG